METLIQLKSTRLQYVGVSLRNPDTIGIARGVTALVGQNGSGKSALTRIIEKGWNFTTNSISSPLGRLTIKRIEFSDIHTLTGFKAQYYQQRFEASMNDDVPTVREIIGEQTLSPAWAAISARLGIDSLLDRKANYLSSGELRKILVARTLSASLPDLLILDNPYIGLDARSRSVLDDALRGIADEGVSIILALCDPGDIPDYTDTVIPLADMTVGKPMTIGRGGAEALRRSVAPLFSYAIDSNKIPRAQQTQEHRAATEEIVRLDRCRVCYGSSVILPEVSWTIKRGERWALCGPNGSGKSTLLSLIHADNPQVYSNSVSVFGRRRGSGESIWDVKRRIGYISPEMHLYFGGGSSTVREIIARGLNDTVGSFTRIDPQQFSKADRWIELLHLEAIAGRRFNTLSCGEQRMTLLARTFIKNPELIILDEPMHGLDSCRKKAVKSIIDSLCTRDNSTLIYVTHCPEERPESITRTLTLPPP